ncbi:ubiquitin carboxyl-terminal hydrolase CYLD isoform X1 [Hippoglossus hippoglossus]|uniref:ubiquitin carboxyl-terminal hydrolase CYLD isoform X1 n=1 Tax=Hippoglossus hippoglossus TaxID=8267 RepID=UPI00148E806D|nr:ubiquitin carboxyl-terminal hydrolase CYLD isoform X1 [Hippoglossus hippoglossus]
MTSPANHYFIITEKPEYYTHINPGHICYISEHSYKRHSSSSKLPVFPFTTSSCLDYDIDRKCLSALPVKSAELLLALPDEAERLKWFREGAALPTALGLTLGTAVIVQAGEEELRGSIRYIGRLTKTQNPLSATFFGIELQGADRGQGDTDGSHQRETLFSCAKDCGVFVPFSRVRPLVPSSLSPSGPEPQPRTEELSSGDRVTYYTSNKTGHGMVVDVLETEGKHFVRISTDMDENGKTGGEVKVPLDCVTKGEVPAEAEGMDVDAPLVEQNKDDLYLSLTVNSVVEVTLAKGNSYGIIRWIGHLTDKEQIMAGLELEEDRGVSDGTFKNKRHFTCPPKRALFVKLISCRPDSRFQSNSANRSKKMLKQDDTESVGELELSSVKLETVPPISTEQVNEILIGQMKGIQGHCNSCYMDAALFSLFSCSSVLDSMLFKSTAPQDAPIQKTLLRDIVNPLRSKGFVEGQHIMKLRQQLQKHGYSGSFTTDEKDPEEFLIVIMHNILSLEPLLKLSAGGEVQESYCYQIFLDQNHSLVLPTVQQLLEHSFHSAGLKLAEVPSCLILQMPRFGKKFKMFEKIIPSLELDITDLLSEGEHTHTHTHTHSHAQHTQTYRDRCVCVCVSGSLQCMLCGTVAEVQCTDCFKDPVFSQTGFKVFCRTCSSQVHCHPQRQSHQPSLLDIPKGYLGRLPPQALTRDKLELFAVLCIETSHYVSFIKHGPHSEDWIFFDSMADREGETDGYNIPEVRACPEVGTYLEMSPTELARQVPRDMKGVAKRLFCDAYMYLYQSTSMCIYR